jgi:hypothetical protein
LGQEDRENSVMRNFVIYTPLNFVRGLRWAGHVARMKDVKNAYSILSDNLKGRDNLRDRR